MVLCGLTRREVAQGRGRGANAANGRFRIQVDNPATRGPVLVKNDSFNVQWSCNETFGQQTSGRLGLSDGPRLGSSIARPRETGGPLPATFNRMRIGLGVTRS